MKSDIKTTLNKLIAYARDNLMLDALDEVYTLNRLAAICGVPPVEPTDADADGATIDSLIEELKAAAPDADVEAVKDALMPAPHTVDYYFADELSRNPNKAFDFLFGLYKDGGLISGAESSGADGYIRYSAKDGACKRPVTLDVGEPIHYTPLAVGNRIAALEYKDILSADMTARLVAYATAYGGTIAKRLGDDSDYLVCADSAIEHATVKKTVSDDAVKVAVLDYPVTALAFSGVGRNAVMRQATRVYKHAIDAHLPCVAACTVVKDTPVLFAVFADNIAKTDIINSSDALSACGVVATPDMSGLLSVLEKGTALSTDLFAFKSLYSEIGGVKLGAKAASALDGAVAKLIKQAIAAVRSASEPEAEALLQQAE